MTHWHSVLAAILLLGGCAGSDTPREDDWSGTIDTLPGGAVRVSNPSDGIWTDAPRRIVEAVRIGIADGEGAELFGQIMAVAVGPAGHIHIIDGHAQEIRVFTQNGGHVRTIARSGEGPGEFGQPTGLAWDEADRLWVVDPGNARYSVFDSAGAYLESHPRELGTLLPWLSGTDTADKLYDVAPRGLPDGTALYTYYRVDDAGAAEDSFPPLTNERPRQPVPMAVFDLMPRLTFAFDPKGFLWFAETDALRIYQRTLDGDTVRVVELTRDPARVSEAEKDSIVERVNEQPLPFGNFERSDIPDRRPFFERIVVASAGGLWLLSRDSGTGTGFDVFDEEGRYLRPVRTQLHFASMPPPIIRGDTIIGVVTDEADVPYVVRGRVESR